MSKPIVIEYNKPPTSNIESLRRKIARNYNRFNIRKFAASIAIYFINYFYLLLSGSPISAERAFIMSTICSTRNYFRQRN
ncbi:hypothetical protein [Candidatus Midichloria mitochondrii]|uniref:Uncharacterized protein n=1 Tax=Midichloria mitochondrii (strain IricVA) TaxID=696127 RepID=F7XV79_MIDMI|nr:hypothetical protein midi_00262 [Candidatus Midichloria mitochondrii IricVA]